jgi:hypothetical protein
MENQMDENDRNNLNFLMSVSQKGLQEWYKQASEDDIQYALELMNWFQDELDEEALESKLLTSDFKESKQILERFKT